MNGVGEKATEASGDGFDTICDVAVAEVRESFADSGGQLLAGHRVVGVDFVGDARIACGFGKHFQG